MDRSGDSLDKNQSLMLTAPVGFGCLNTEPHRVFGALGNGTSTTFISVDGSEIRRKTPVDTW